MRVVVVGAGYAGLNAAKRLSWERGFQVTLVNPRRVFVERIRLHQYVAGNHPATVPLERLLAPGTEFRSASATLVDRERRLVHLSRGEPLPYDFVIYALGTGDGPPVGDGNWDSSPSPGLAPFGTWESSARLKWRLAQIHHSDPVTVVGGGLTGIELAAELGPVRRIRLITAGPLAPSVGAKGRDHLRRGLRDLGVETIEDTRVLSSAAGEVTYGDGGHAESALTIFTTGASFSTLSSTSGLPVDERGALLVDKTLTSLADHSVIGAGDAVAIRGLPVRGSCQAALPLGAHAAETVIARARNEVPAQIRPRFVSQNISLGRRQALWQRTDHADRPTSFILTGRPAAWVKERVCAGTVRYVLNPQRGRPSSYSWS